MIKIEEWRTITGFSNYEVSNYGDIRNKQGYVLKSEKSNKGYVRVVLYDDKHKRYKKLVHRLVAEAFIPNPYDLPQVNHKDENRQNNNVDNLEWVTPIENLNYSNVIEKASVAKFHAIKCVETGKIYKSIKDACNELNLEHSNIVACCNNRRNKCGGYKWEYVKM